MTKIQIKGMTCNHCKMRVEKALKQAGCGKVKVELETGTATADTLGGADSRNDRESGLSMR